MPEFLSWAVLHWAKREMLYRYLDERADSPEPVDVALPNDTTPRWRWLGARAIRVPRISR